MHIFKKYKRHIALVSIVLLLGFVIWTHYQTTFSLQNSSTMSLSVSDDGMHIISVHIGGNAYLWDIVHQEKKLVASNVNLHSAYFIQGRPEFMLQDKSSNEIVITNLKQEEIIRFNSHFKTYGHVITPDHNIYIASDKKWELHQLTNQAVDHIIKHFDGGPDVSISGKLLDLQLVGNLLVSSGEGLGYDTNTVADGPNLITAGEITNPAVNISLWAGVMTWDILTGKPIARMPGMVYKTHATLSPDGRYVVAGDENGLLNAWLASTGKKFWHGASLTGGLLIGDPKDESSYWDHLNPVLPPKDYCQKRAFDSKCRYKFQTNAIRFIDKTHFLRFTEGVPYAILYDVLNPRPLKYFHLGKDVNPDTYGYTASHRIATAPKAGILVMAQGRDNDINKGSGILVYKYDKKKQTLTRIWAPEGPKAHRVKRKRV